MRLAEVRLESRSVQMGVVNRRLFCLVILAMAGMITVKAWAHRDRGPDDPCRKQIGASLLHLTLYQPHFDPDAEYCEEVPRAGKTIVVVDVTEGELRQVPMSVELVATNASGEPRTVLSLPPQVYQNGVATTEVTLNEGSDYSARVVVDLGAGKEPQLLSFPIRVTAWYMAMVTPALIAMGVLMFVVISVIRYQMTSKQQEFPVGKIKMRRVAH